MPNGKIYGVLSVERKKVKRTEVYEIQPKEGTFVLKCSKKAYYLKGAVTSIINKIFVTGSQEGKTKSGCQLNLLNDPIFEDLPEMLVGRHSHAMTVFNQKYLYVFGGVHTQ